MTLPRSRPLTFAVGLFALLGLALTPHSARAGVTVYNSGPTPYGNTNALSSQWWQWAYSIPSNITPFLDPTGANAYTNNNGPVFFLSGTFATITNPNTGFSYGSADRTISIQPNSSGVAVVYFPILNDEFDNIGGPAFGFNLMSTADLRATAASYSAMDQNLYATIDGVNVLGNPANHHDISPTPFDVTLPNNNLYQFEGFNGSTLDPVTNILLPNVPAGTYLANALAYPNGGTGVDTVPGGARNSPVGDGFYILATLTPGEHVIAFGGQTDNTFGLDIIYNIDVVPEPATLLLWGSGLAGLAGFARWRKKRTARAFSRMVSRCR